MSREAFSDFLYTVEHSSALRRELKKCTNYKAIIDLANNYGFNLSMNDFKEDVTAEKIEEWFKTNTIPPIKKSTSFSD